MSRMHIPSHIREIAELDNGFHDAGVLGKEVILEIWRLTRDMEVSRSVETGSGKSTLLLSWISAHHQCFTYGNEGNVDARSLTAVQESPLLRKDNVEFILGPTQRTLPRHEFNEPLQLAFIDGPHGFPFPQLEYYFLYPQLEEGGLLILDDIHIPTIATLYQFLREDEMFEHVSDIYTTAFFRRTAAPVFDPYGDGWWLQNYNIKRVDKQTSNYYGHNLNYRVHSLLVRLFGRPFADGVRKRIRRG